MKVLVALKRVIDYSAQKVSIYIFRSKSKTTLLILPIPECISIPFVKSPCKKQQISKLKNW